MHAGTSLVDVTAPASVESSMTRWSRLSSRTWASLLLCLAVIVGGALRIVGARFGFPFLVHPDEWAIVRGAMDLSARHSFEPQFLGRPDHLEIKLNFLVDFVYARFRYGLWPNVAFEAHPQDFYLIARLITAAFGIGCIVMAYFIGKRFAPMVGAIAAVLFALFPGYVLHSHYATPDVPITFVTLVVVWLCIDYLANPRASTIAWTGGAIGAGVTIKYPAAILGITVAAVVVIAAARMRRWRLILDHGALSVAALVGTAFVVSPVLFVKYGGVRDAIVNEARPTHLGADGLGWTGNAWFYIDSFLLYAGVIVGIAAVAGMVWSVYRRSPASVPLWTGAIVWLALSAASLHWERWGMPMHVTPLLFAALGIHAAFAALWDKLPWGSRIGRAAARTLLVVVCSLALTNNLASSVAIDSSLVAPDTRRAAQQFAGSIGATPDNSIYEPYTPFSPSGGTEIFEDFVVRDGKLYLSDRARHDNPKYLIISSFMRSRYLADPKYVDEHGFYQAVDDNLPLLRTFESTGRGESKWELPNIMLQDAYLRRMADDGLTGPVLYFYDISSLQRDPELGG